MVLKFVKDNNYYYDVENNVIHGKKKYSFYYFHELSHYIDHTHKKGYKKVSDFFSYYNQIGTYYFIFIIFIYGLFDYQLINYFLFYYSIYAVFIVIEETRANINGLIWVKKWKNKRLKLRKNGLPVMKKL